MESQLLLPEHVTSTHVTTANLGFPRIGVNRELKFALERFWSGEWDEGELEAVARKLRQAHWKMQVDRGIQQIPSNDFSLYDHVLDTAFLVNAIPARFRRTESEPDLSIYFAMARGTSHQPPLEMTKWFDTNYHYIVPEFEHGMQFRLSSNKLFREYQEAKQSGVRTRPVVLGPVSFVLLGKCVGKQQSRRSVVDAIVPVYEELLRKLAGAGADWVQFDEPCLGMDLNDTARDMLERAYQRLATVAGPKVLLATYFSGLRQNLPFALHLPISGLHLDLVRAPEQLLPALECAPPSLTLSLGVVDGRNIWRSDLDRALALLNLAFDRVGPDRMQIAPSCSLLHVPIDLEAEDAIDPKLKGWMAFAQQKLEEVSFLARAVAERSSAIDDFLATNRRILSERRASTRVCRWSARSRASLISQTMLRRHSTVGKRRAKQARRMGLPVLPTTTIGSFPQTPAIRRARTAWRAGQLSQQEYNSIMKTEIARAISFQQEIGLDVLVHGEFERSDMVEYFSSALKGFASTENGWVQSYGSRCVRPPILYGDVVRPRPISVGWSRYAQSLASAPVKAVITGPVTMLQWSFVRDDISRQQVSEQLALALREEVKDLESAGIRMIQVDEPALREGLPLHRKDRSQYLRWAVDAFRLATAVVRDETQIHTHMCYSDFEDILPDIKRMDADVVSIEAARSGMKVLAKMNPASFPNGISPGVYDIHSPRAPEVQEFERLIRAALRVFAPEQLWISPDCGLKTRQWAEIRPALANMVSAAERVRNELTGVHSGASAHLVTSLRVSSWPYNECSCT